MRKRTALLLAACGTIALGALTGTAVAGDCNGKDHSSSGGGAGAHGNASAPGQQKQDSKAQTAVKAHGSGQAKTHGSGQAKARANGQAKVHGSAKVTVHGRGNSGATVGHHGKAHARVQARVRAGASAGVKPSSATAKNTTAPAGSTQTKLYGNGTTAGQIAMAAGASASTALYGPGNSQPHKVACGSKMIDVHALKGRLSACLAANAAVAGAAGARGSGNGSVSGGVVNGSAGASGNTTVSASAGGNRGAGGSAGVLGAGSTRGAGSQGGSGSPTAAGILGAASSGVRSGTLPFTGFPLWAAVLAGVALLVGGSALRRTGRATA
jgi:hypothetical protein